MNDPARARARAEWLSVIAVASVVDYMRARGEADGDTFSEVAREVLRLDTLPGQLGLALGLTVLWRHLSRPGEPLLPLPRRGWPAV